MPRFYHLHNSSFVHHAQQELEKCLSLAVHLGNNHVTQGLLLESNSYILQYRNVIEKGLLDKISLTKFKQRLRKAGHLLSSTF